MLVPKVSTNLKQKGVANNILTNHAQNKEISTLYGSSRILTLYADATNKCRNQVNTDKTNKLKRKAYVERRSYVQDKPMAYKCFTWVTGLIQPLFRVIKSLLF